ncbi:MAG: hypothetical protein QXD03_03795 [Candidatus Anstonellales archaeon]
MAFILTNKHFMGYIQADKDPENMGRYLVYIPELQPIFSERKGLWLKNDVAVYGDTQDHGKRYGQYFPLKPGTKVIVVFPYNDPNSGRIIRILNDDIPTASYTGTSTPPKEAKKYSTTNMGKPPIRINIPFNAWEDRDEVYQMIRTPSNNLFVIGESTSDKIIPKDSIHLYYKKDHSKIVINNEGFNFITKRNLQALIEGNILINSSFGEMIFGNSFSLFASSFIKLTSDKDDIHIFSGGSTYITAIENAIHITAPYSSRSLINMSTRGDIFIGATNMSSSNIILFSNGSKYGFSSYDTSEYAVDTIVVMSDKDCRVVSGGKITIAADDIEIMASKLTLAYGSKVETGCSSSMVKNFKDKTYNKYVGIKGEPAELHQNKFYNPERDAKSKEVYKSKNELKEREGSGDSEDSSSMSSAIKKARNNVTPPKVRTVKGFESPKYLSDVMALEAIPTKVKEPSYIKFEDEQRIGGHQ